MSHLSDEQEDHKKVKPWRLPSFLKGILIWIAFISILTLIILNYHPAYTELESTAAPLIKALDQYKVEYGYYPENIKALTPTQIVSIPLCPGSNTAITYFKENEIDVYELICYGFFTQKLRYRSRISKWDTFD